MSRVAGVVELSAAERIFLESQVRRHRVPRSLPDRCQMILLCADGLTSKEVASTIGVHEHTVGKWRRRFVRDRLEGLSDEYRPGRPRTVSDEQWVEDGSLDAEQRAEKIYKDMLANYTLPDLDPDIDARLIKYMDNKKASFPDSNIS